ncbi:hypothetical protein TGAM01_v210667 [Trichoderma gamsii]|uniref:Uncharacterized protein n=1 Tax=Trichoderma gamsii TaxID=398673 RepID=A0A2P4Z828_9HYPO|nr:hypothetical protein TGAM01_v210667 [Trichoderma gamsii]PON20436.1 hypothetical protein TGAM01_v210667 [Trichoderma gamsii]
MSYNPAQYHPNNTATTFTRVNPSKSEKNFTLIVKRNTPCQ